MAAVDDGTWEFRPHGELTPEVLAALVEEARRGYSCELGLQFVGRPAYEVDEPLPPRIVFRVPREVLADAQRRADEEGLALSDLAGNALREYLGREAVRKRSGGS